MTVTTMNEIEFTIPGIPIPQGSSRAFVVKGQRGPRANVTAANSKTKGWRNDVALMAAQHAQSSLWEGPVEIFIWFRMPRPKSIKRRKREHPIVKPDLDKLVRSVLDSLTGIIWRDDCQVVRISTSKQYDDDGVKSGVTIKCREVF